MKNIFKTILTVSCAAVLASCVKESKPLASAVSLDKTDIVFEGQGAAGQTVTVEADGDWIAVSPEWITLEPAVGSGKTEVKVTAADNVDIYKELSGPRTGVITFLYGTTGSAAVVVSQKGETGLDTSRQYSKVTKAEDFAAGSYLIVYNDGTKDHALKPFNATSESYYSYIFADEVTVKDGRIDMANGTNAFTFEAAEGGFKLKMSNGRYLFQSASYNNFYSTDNADKADLWSVGFDESGLATIKNVTVPDKVIVYQTSYSNAGGYSPIPDGAFLPSLYKDAKPASDEVLVLPETVSVIADATEAVISVQSNRTWKVRCHDEWIKDFTKSGEGNGEIKLAFDANASTTEARTASILVIGETANFTVSFVQNKVATDIQGLAACLVSTDSSNPSAYKAVLPEGKAVVSYVNGNNAYIEDESGAVLLYKKSHGLVAGQTVSGTVSGSGYLYSGLPEITSLEGAQVADGGTIPCTEVTIADLLKDYDSYLSRRIIIKDVTVTDGIDGSDRDGVIEQDGKTVAVRAQSKTLSLPADSKGALIVFPSTYNGKKQLSFYANDMFTPAN